MHDYNTGRATAAANALVYLAIAFGALSFWSDAIAAGGPIDYLVALLLTVAIGSASLLLSGVVGRFSEARLSGAWFTAGAAIALGIVLACLEAGMTHQGLAWLDARHDLAPDWVLVLASFGLSGFNVLALYVFARQIPKAARKLPSEIAVFGSHRERQTLNEIGDKLRRSGAM